MKAYEFKVTVKGQDFGFVSVEAQSETFAKAAVYKMLRGFTDVRLESTEQENKVVDPRVEYIGKGTPNPPARELDYYY